MNKERQNGGMEEYIMFIGDDEDYNTHFNQANWSMWKHTPTSTSTKYSWMPTNRYQNRRRNTPT